MTIRKHANPGTDLFVGSILDLRKEISSFSCDQNYVDKTDTLRCRFLLLPKMGRDRHGAAATQRATQRDRSR